MSETPNRDQIEGWNNAVGKTWTRFQKQLDIQLAPIGARVLEIADVRPEEDALDIGCGAGAMTVDLSKRAGAHGRVAGVDISGPLLAVARARAVDPAAAPIAWIEADAQVHAFAPQTLDLAISRFGVMFFDDPAAAFANLHRATKPGGRLVFACWRGIEENPWLTLPLDAAAHLVPLPRPTSVGAPGPFAFADPKRVDDMLGRAGWTKVALDRFDAPIGGSAARRSGRADDARGSARRGAPRSRRQRRVEGRGGSRRAHSARTLRGAAGRVHPVRLLDCGRPGLAVRPGLAARMGIQHPAL